MWVSHVSHPAREAERHINRSSLSGHAGEDDLTFSSVADTETLKLLRTRFVYGTRALLRTLIFT